MTTALPALASSTASTASTVTDGDVRRYLPLVMRAAARFRRRLPANVLHEDLVAAGTIGLLDALRKNDMDRGPAFEWYASVRIRGAIVDELRRQDWSSRRHSRPDPRSSQPPASHATAVVCLDDLSDHVRAATLVDSAAQSPLEAALAGASRAVVESAVNELPPRERMIVQRHYFQDVGFKLIAAELGVSEPRISQLHTRAMSTLRSLLAAGRDEAA